MKRIPAVLFAAAVLIGALYYSQNRPEPLKVSGFIEADEIRVGSRVGGRVAAVHVFEGALVTSGTVLLELEPYDLLKRRAQFTADLAARQADLDRLEAGFRTEEVTQAKARRDELAAQLAELVSGPRPQEIATAGARVEAANAALTLADREFKRIKQLHESKIEAQENLDRATEDLKAAQAGLRVREEELNLLQAGTRAEQIDAARARLEEAEQAWLLRKNGYRVEEINAARAATRQAAAVLAAVEQQINELTIRAPLNGRIEALDLQPGDLIAPNAPVLSMLDLSRLWVRAYVPEKHLNLRIDQPVEIGVDGFGERRFKARITFIARQGEFTPSNVQTPEDRAKQVFRIKATLDEGLDVLRPGMAGDVWLKTPAPRADP